MATGYIRLQKSLNVVLIVEILQQRENILDCTFGGLLMLQLVLMYGNMEIKAGTYSFTLAHEWFMYI